MSDLQTILAVLGGLVVLSGVAGGTYAHFKSTEDKEHADRLRRERDDYLSRLNFIEPRVKLLEQQNEVLISLHNPSQQIENLAEQENANHVEAMTLLQATHRTLQQIDKHLLGSRGGPDA